MKLARQCHLLKVLTNMYFPIKKEMKNSKSSVDPRPIAFWVAVFLTPVLQERNASCSWLNLILPGRSVEQCPVNWRVKKPRKDRITVLGWREDMKYRKQCAKANLHTHSVMRKDVRGKKKSDLKVSSQHYFSFPKHHLANMMERPRIIRNKHIQRLLCKSQLSENQSIF